MGNNIPSMAQFLCENQIVDSVERFLVGIGISLPAALWVICMVRWMIDGELSPTVGVLGIGLAFGLISLTVWAPYPWVAGLIFVVMLSSLATFSFARSMLDQREMKEIDLRQFENAYRSYGERPDNIAAHLGIAKAAHGCGLLSQAIAIAQNALNALGTEIDPVKNASMRDLFKKEDQDLKEWIRESHGKSVLHSVKCPRCQHVNPPHSIACVSCSAPYLLDLARNANVKSRAIARICVAWMVTATMIIVAAVCGNSFPGPIAAVISIGVFVVGSVVMFLMLREKQIGT